MKQDKTENNIHQSDTIAFNMVHMICIQLHAVSHSQIVILLRVK